MTNTHIEHNNLFASKEEYQAFIARWKALARAKKLTATDCLLRCLLLKQDVERVMPMTKNEVRLANGAAYTAGVTLAAHGLRAVDPVRAKARRLALLATLAARSTPVRDGQAQPSWGEGWVNLEEPSSFATGLSLARLMQAAGLAAQVGA